METDQPRATYYDVLGVASSATLDQIKAAYRARIAAFHPDRNASPDANDIAVVLNEAWHVLGDGKRRQLYDAAIPPEPGTQQRQPPPKDTDGGSERLPWVCSRCGRQVPRYIDQCRCGQVRPQAPEHSNRATHEGRSAGPTLATFVSSLKNILAKKAMTKKSDDDILANLVGARTDIDLNQYWWHRLAKVIYFAIVAINILILYAIRGGIIPDATQKNVTITGR